MDISSENGWKFAVDPFDPRRVYLDKNEVYEFGREEWSEPLVGRLADFDPRMNVWMLRFRKPPYSLSA